jgi:exodeoxyribonuclease VII small subunit
LERPAKEPEPFNFEKAVAQIEEIIERIETGQVGLEKSIAEYERGIGLLKRCREALGWAEQRVEELTARMQADAKEGGSRGVGAAEKKGPAAPDPDPGESSPETPF